MLDKMIGVSPPQKGKTPDSNETGKPDLRGASKSDYKKDFEKALSKKLDEKKEHLEKKMEENRKDTKTREAELRAAQKEKKSLGGIKKKVTKDDDKIVSNNMASQESKVETPDLKNENLAQIKIETSNKKSETSTTEQSVAALPLAEDGAKPATELALQNANQIQPEGAATENIKANADSLEAAVDFKSESLTADESLLLKKVQNLGADKKEISENKNSEIFEKSVLSRLQNEQAQNSPAQAFSSTESESDLSQQDSETSHEFKSDGVNINELHQAAGQTQSDFKNHLSALAAPKESTASFLEENREANMSEIMSKAQYLVKEGGGEVTIKMSPEGMGEVQLKVMLLDGKLNIEMQTQDRNVKKLIEESLSELKSGLAAHRLSLEHVKIDTVSATNADNNTQSQSNLSQGGFGERARDFMNDFQQSMNHHSGKKSTYNEGRGAAPSTSSAVNSIRTSEAVRTYGGTKGATINRVA